MPLDGLATLYPGVAPALETSVDRSSVPAVFTSVTSEPSAAVGASSESAAAVPRNRISPSATRSPPAPENPRCPSHCSLS